MAKVLGAGSFSDSAGREILLAGIAAAPSAQDALLTWLKGPQIRIAFAGPSQDRYRRLQAQVFAGGEWLQMKLVRQGLARVSPNAASAPCVAQLLVAEKEARAAKRGFWRDDFHVRGPDELRGFVGTFQIVEGKVTTASLVRGRAYINFGADYKTDFTVTIAPEDMKLFRSVHGDPKKLAGLHVRVRGLLESYQGPEIVLLRPEALEVLDPVVKKKRASNGAGKKKTARKAPGRSKSKKKKEA